MSAINTIKGVKGFVSIPFEDRFWSGVKKGNKKECWPWTRSHDGRYGWIFQAGNRRLKTHRAAWQLTYGEVPKGMNVCHKCDNPICCNPNHLFIGTQKENMQDSIKKGRFANQKATPEDVRIMKILRSNGVKLSKIASLFGMHDSRVGKLVLTAAQAELERTK